MTPDIALRFRSNSKGFWKQYKWLIIIFVTALICDCASTVYFMLHTGPESELHPGVQYASELLGPVAGPIIIMILKCIAGIAVSIYLRKYALYIFVAGSGIFFWAAWYNIWGSYMYQPIF